MTIKIIVELPDELAERARAVAVQAQRRFEDLLVEWIDHAVSEPPIASLPADQLLALCDAQMDPRQQEELSELLEAQRERTLQGSGRTRLDDLLRGYRRGLVRKAQALQEAVRRGLRPPLN